jgi:Holliday junction resolvase RusA-like endonuclease
MIYMRVLGVPAPQGSKTLMPNGAILEGKSKVGREKHKAWRSAVAEAALEARRATPLDGPLWLRIDLRMPRPKARKTARYCDRRPDVDKIIRTTCDALTDAGLITDDSRIVELHVLKLYADPSDPWTGADISIHAMAQP